jgi:hypothetical protein
MQVSLAPAGVVSLGAAPVGSPSIGSQVSPISEVSTAASFGGSTWRVQSEPMTLPATVAEAATAMDVGV